MTDFDSNTFDDLASDLLADLPTESLTGFAFEDFAEVATSGLANPRFVGDPDLELIIDNRALMFLGWRACAVERVQIALEDLGFPLPTFGADGDFGSETRNAVMGFQQHMGLLVDGIVGAQTLGTLDSMSSPIASREASCGSPSPAPFPAPLPRAETTLLVFVLDPNGSVFPGVTVRVEGNFSFRGVTGEQGFVRFPELPPDGYVVTAERAGFDPVAQTVALQTGQPQTITLQLSTRIGSAPAVAEFVPVTVSGQDSIFITMPLDGLAKQFKEEATRTSAVSKAQVALLDRLREEQARHDAQNPDAGVVCRVVAGSTNTTLDEQRQHESDDDAGGITFTTESFTVTATVTAMIECRSQN